MRTETINIFKFDELSEDAQQKALENLSDINVDHNWWESIYEDAAQIGLKITSFDLDRNRHAKGTADSLPIVCHAIIENHGPDCQTYKTAQDFLTQWNELVAEHSNGIDTERVAEDHLDAFDSKADDLEAEFLTSLLEDYSILLQNESEYLQSREAIIETIQANEYEFTEDGKLY